jgi:hypothetical protein
LVLTAHITFSVGWFGAVAAFLALSITGLTSRHAETVRTAYTAMELIARFVIVPLAFGSLLSGIVQSLGTPWTMRDRRCGTDEITPICAVVSVHWGCFVCPASPSRISLRKRLIRYGAGQRHRSDKSRML